LAAQDVGDRSGCIQLILSKIARRLVLPMMAANAVPPTSVFGLNRWVICWSKCRPNPRMRQSSNLQQIQGGQQISFRENLWTSLSRVLETGEANLLE
jgi:hypothetical protein